MQKDSSQDNIPLRSPLPHYHNHNNSHNHNHNSHNNSLHKKGLRSSFSVKDKSLIDGGSKLTATPKVSLSEPVTSEWASPPKSCKDLIREFMVSLDSTLIDRETKLNVDFKLEAASLREKAAKISEIEDETSRYSTKTKALKNIVQTNSFLTQKIHDRDLLIKDEYQKHQQAYTHYEKQLQNEKTKLAQMKQEYDILEKEGKETEAQYSSEQQQIWEKLGLKIETSSLGTKMIFRKIDEANPDKEFWFQIRLKKGENTENACFEPVDSFPIVPNFDAVVARINKSDMPIGLICCIMREKFKQLSYTQNI